MLRQIVFLLTMFHSFGGPYFLFPKDQRLAELEDKPSWYYRGHYTV